MFTEQQLKESAEFKEWVTPENVVLIHNCYYDSKEPYGSYIVISKEDDDNPSLYTITRFFQGGNNINVSVDYQDVTAEEIFPLLLSDYSGGLA